MLGSLAIALAFGGCTATDDMAGSPQPPEWAPYYDSYARYYYFPDMYTYYDVYSGNFIYWNGFSWTFAPTPPLGYGLYDLSRSYIIVLDDDVYDPWLRHNYYSTIYPKGYYYGPRNLSHPRGIYPYRGYDENANKPIVPGEDRSVDPVVPAKPRPDLDTRTLPEGRNRPNTISPGRESPRIQQQPRIERPAPQQQPRIQSPVPSQPRTAPSPTPKVGKPRGGN